jgi:hypothetical protein
VLGNLILDETNAPVFGYVAIDSVNRCMYIFYRGTATSQEFSQDKMFQQVVIEEQFYDVETFDDVCPNVQVHKGFSEIFGEIDTQLSELFTEGINSVDRIIVAGHSLGGRILNFKC